MAAKTPTPVRTHILNALMLGVQYELGKAKAADKTDDLKGRQLHANRAYQLARSVEMVEAHKFTTC